MMTPRQKITVDARLTFQALREAAYEGTDHPVLDQVLDAGEGAFVAANLARLEGLPESEPLDPEYLEPRLLGQERMFLALL